MSESEKAAAELAELLRSKGLAVQNIDDGDLVIDDRFHIHVERW